ATVIHVPAIHGMLVFDGAVRAIGTDADANRYYGGSFTRINGYRAPGAIGFDAAGNANAAFNLAVGFNGPVHAAIFLADGSAILGGDFTTYRDQPARGIAHLSATGSLDAAFSPASGANGFDGSVYALAVESTSGAIYANSDFKHYRNAPAA